MSDWIRHGECNACGDCCRQATNCLTLLVPIADEAYGRIRYGEPHAQFLGNDGSRVFQIRGPVYLPCPKLEGDRCGVHESKPQYCRDMPAGPEDIEGLSRCSYWFVHRETGEVRGNAGASILEADQKRD
jgi:Fe-S-cluster containining protein